MKVETFKNHVFFDKLDQLNQRLSEDESREKIDIENFSFFETGIKYLSDRIKVTIPVLVQEAEMNALGSEVDAALQQINAFLGNNNVGHLTNANNNFYSALSRIRNFPLPFSKSDFNFSRIVADFQETVKNKYNELEAENAALKESINQFQVDLKNKETELQRLFKLLESKETEITNLNSNFQTEFSNIKAKANQEYELERKAFRSEFDEEKTELQNEIETIKNNIDSNTSELINKLNAKLIEANNIVNVIGNVGVTGNYQLIANEHRSAANFWRWIALSFMAVFSGLLVWTIIDLSTEGFNWTKSLIRLIAAAAFIPCHICSERVKQTSEIGNRQSNCRIRTRIYQSIYRTSSRRQKAVN